MNHGFPCVVRESGAGSTHLGDYDRFVGGDRRFDGTVSVAAGDQLTCLITNVRKGTEPLPAELTVTKICVPEDDGGRLDLTVDGQTERDGRCGQSFGPVTLAPASHHVSESAGTDTGLGDYTTTIGGACARADRGPSRSPSGAVRPARTGTSRSSSTSGSSASPAVGARGLSSSRSARSCRWTTTEFVVRVHRRGVLRVSIRKAFDCPQRPPKRIGIVGAATPPVTG